MRFLLLVFLLLAGGGAFYILEYNAVVDARQGITETKSAIVKAQLDNADFKDALYRVIDPATLKALAAGRGLSPVRDPQYFQSAQWLSDSSR